LTATPFACRELVELVTEYLDGALPAVVVETVEEHLQGCDGCAAYVRQIRVAVYTLGATPAPVLDPDFCARLQVAFRTWSRGSDEMGEGP
jgi:anti-sigma factor RsiW